MLTKSSVIWLDTYTFSIKYSKFGWLIGFNPNLKDESNWLLMIVEVG